MAGTLSEGGSTQQKCMQTMQRPSLSTMGWEVVEEWVEGGRGRLGWKWRCRDEKYKMSQCESLGGEG